MENDSRCTCRNCPLDSEIYCPVHTTTEDYLQKSTQNSEHENKKDAFLYKQYKHLIKNNMDNKYYIPKIDKVLSEDGWIRPNESLVYVKKFKKSNSEGGDHYIISFPIPAINLTAMEAWFDKGEEEVIRAAIRSFHYASANAVTREEPTLEIILILTADFYYHEGNEENYQKYVAMYEKLSGKKYR